MQDAPRGQSVQDADRSPSVDEQLWLDHLRLARTGDGAVLARLVAEYERYALALARRLRRDGEPAEDLDQVALEALVAALRRFDPERGVPFVAFATPTIIGSLRRHYRDHGWLLRVPRRVHEYAVAQREATERLASTLGREPTAPELASELGMDLDLVLEAQEALHARDLQSFDAPGPDGDNLGDRTGSDDVRLAMCEDRVAVAAAMATLDERAKELLRLYFFESRSQSEIADLLGMSQMQVSRLLAAALRRLRSRVGPR